MRALHRAEQQGNSCRCKQPRNGKHNIYAPHSPRPPLIPSSAASLPGRWRPLPRWRHRRCRWWPLPRWRHCHCRCWAPGWCRRSRLSWHLGWCHRSRHRWALGRAPAGSAARSQHVEQAAQPGALQPAQLLQGLPRRPAGRSAIEAPLCQLQHAAAPLQADGSHLHRFAIAAAPAWACKQAWAGAMAQPAVPAAAACRDPGACRRGRRTIWQARTGEPRPMSQLCARRPAPCPTAPGPVQRPAMCAKGSGAVASHAPSPPSPASAPCVSTGGKSGSQREGRGTGPNSHEQGTALQQNNS